MNRRDLELLSAYLDGELKPAETLRLETRLKTDPELASALNDLRAARTLLRKLPARKAPRNFTLTRKMVGQNPPLPRTYPAFRLATVVATLLFFFSFGVNFVSTQMATPVQFGMGGGGAEPYAVEEAAPQAAAPAEEPPLALAPAQPTENALRAMETPSAKNSGDGGAAAPDQPPALVEPLSQPQSPAPPVPAAWQIALAAVAAVSALLMGLMRQLAARRWK